MKQIVFNILKEARWIKYAEFEQSKEFITNLLGSIEFKKHNEEITVPVKNEEIRIKCEKIINTIKSKPLRGMIAVHKPEIVTDMHITRESGEYDEYDFIFAGNKINAKFGYHITERSNLHNIQSVGLLPNFPEKNASEAFGATITYSMILVYKAIFLAPTKKELPKYLNFSDQVILKVNLQHLDCYEDPIGSVPLKHRSIVCFDPISAENIEIVKEKETI